jgi:hypothetical protein
LADRISFIFSSSFWIETGVIAMMTPQQRTRNYLTERGWLVGSVERRKKFPDRKKSPCRVCGHQPMIEISSDLWEIFDIAALKPSDGSQENCAVIFVQTTSRNNHSTRRNKILASMEAKLVLLSGARILIQSWRQAKDSNRWEALDEWITLDHYKQAPHYPSTVAQLMEIKRKAKAPDLPPGSTLPLSPDLGAEPF